MRTEAATQVQILQNDHSSVSGNGQPSSSSANGLSEPFHDANAGHHEVEHGSDQLMLAVETHNDCIKMNANIHSQGDSLVVIGENRVETHQIEVFGDPETEKTVSEDRYLESSIETSCGSNPQPTVGMSQDVEMGVRQKMDCIQEKEDDADGTAHDISVCNLNNSNLSLSSETASSGKNMSNALGTEDDSTSNASMSSQIRVIDVLEEIIADARNNKVSAVSHSHISRTYITNML